jgi:hypothetical protein
MNHQYIQQIYQHILSTPYRNQCCHHEHLHQTQQFWHHKLANTVEEPVFPPHISGPSPTILTAQTTNTVQEPVLPLRTSAPSSIIPTAHTTNTVQESVFPLRTPAEAKSSSVNLTRNIHQQSMSTNQATPQPVAYASDQPIFPPECNTCQPDQSSPLMSSTILSDMSIIAEVKSYSDALPSHNEVRLDLSLQA